MSLSTPPFAPSADRRNLLDRAHHGDIEGALGTVHAFDTGPRVSLRRKLATLLAVAGPGIVVMLADNDAGTFSVFAQAGQNQGAGLLWVLLALAPALYVTQEMVARLGAVTGSGYARLTRERFGTLWCAFTLGDLLVLNLATLVTEFIGVALAMSYFGVSRYLSVPVSVALLVAVTATGSFRRWERAMYVMITANLALIPLALIHHPRPGSLVGGLLPALGGRGTNSTILLLVALIGTTIVPWQLFFQQSTVVDKRITPRWLSYERADTAIGAVLFAACAGAVLALSATAFSGSDLHGHFTDVGVVADAIGNHLGSVAGAVFAVALLNASLLCATAVSLSGSYAFAEALGFKHSLHRSLHDAKKFHLSFAAILAVAAGVVLVPGLPLGLFTTLVQALAGILLPSTLVLLLMLCNDSDLLGPLTNGRLLNAVAGGAVSVILGLSTLLTVTTLAPGLRIEAALLITGGVLTAGGLTVTVAIVAGRGDDSCSEQLSAWQRHIWSSPRLESLPALRRSRPRVVALALLRGYVLVITVLLAVKVAGLLPS